MISLKIKQVSIFLSCCVIVLKTVSGEAAASSDSSNRGNNDFGMERNGLMSAMNQLPQALQSDDIFGPYARSYIASRLRRYTIQMKPKTNSGSKSRYNSNSRMYHFLNRPILGSVPLVSPESPTPSWIPGELIANQITTRQLRLIDESPFGPLKSVTMFPSVMSAILVFNKPYNPERLAEVLKINFGVESEPNGIIIGADKS